MRPTSAICCFTQDRSNRRWRQVLLRYGPAHPDRLLLRRRPAKRGRVVNEDIAAMSESTSVHSSVEQSKRTPARRMKGDRCCPDSQSPSWMARVRVISCRDLSSTLQTSLSRTTLNNPTADRHLTKSGQLNHRVCKLQHLL